LQWWKLAQNNQAFKDRCAWLLPFMASDLMVFWSVFDWLRQSSDYDVFVKK